MRIQEKCTTQQTFVYVICLSQYKNNCFSLDFILLGKTKITSFFIIFCIYIVSCTHSTQPLYIVYVQYPTIKHCLCTVPNHYTLFMYRMFEWEWWPFLYIVTFFDKDFKLLTKFMFLIKELVCATNSDFIIYMILHPMSWTLDFLNY